MKVIVFIFVNENKIFIIFENWRNGLVEKSFYYSCIRL